MEGGKYLETLKQKYLNRLPELAEVQKNFVADRKWKCYKRNLVGEIVGKRMTSDKAPFRRVPTCYRLEERHYLQNEDIV